MTLGILGYGFVGKSLFEAVNDKHHFLIWDSDETKRTPKLTFEQFVLESRAIFVSVPTPMEPSGKCHTGIVESVVQDIANVLNANERFKYVFIRSTVPPGTCEQLQKMSSFFEIIFLPEFLTEANYLGDFLNAEYLIIGTPDFISDEPLLEEILTAITDNNYFAPEFIEMKWSEAEMLKYATNVFLATKVIFNNEIKDLCDSLGINYENVAQGMQNDVRLGTSHWKVPGPDGRRGYSNSCFPKDVNALLHVMKERGVDSTLLSAQWQKNLLLRPDRDWENLKGRAVIEINDVRPSG